MTSYQNRTEIQQELAKLLPYQIQECKKCDELPHTLEEIIRHNFQAKFVCYDKENRCIEVGVEEQEATDGYPEISIRKLKLEDAASQLKKTFRKSDHDLEFYGRLLAGLGSVDKIDQVVLV